MYYKLFLNYFLVVYSFICLVYVCIVKIDIYKAVPCSLYEWLRKWILSNYTGIDLKSSWEILWVNCLKISEAQRGYKAKCDF